MEKEEFEKNIDIAKGILEGISIPGKKDSMLAAAKSSHVERMGILLNDTLVRTEFLSQGEIDVVVHEFKETYSDAFLKFVQKGEG